MTDPIEKIDTSGKIGRGKPGRRFSGRVMTGRHNEEEQGDNVTISSEARQRAAGDKHGRTPDS